MLKFFKQARNASGFFVGMGSISYAGLQGMQKQKEALEKENPGSVVSFNWHNIPEMGFYCTPEIEKDTKESFRPSK